MNLLKENFLQHGLGRGSQRFEEGERSRHGRIAGLLDVGVHVCRNAVGL